MDAPLYPPATAFVAPKRLARPVSVRDTPVAELKADAAAWAIVLKEEPDIDKKIGLLAVHHGNFSLESFLPFGMLPPGLLDRIEPQFRALEAAR